jgi:hypothetical protein
MKILRCLLPALFALTGFVTQARAQAVITLGTAADFAVLGGTTVTGTGATIVNGDLGVSPAASYSGFPPGVVNGTVHLNDATAIQARADAVTAYNVLAGEALTTTLTGQDLGGMTLTTGVYFFAATAQLTGILTLDALGDSNARFDFQIGSTLGTAEFGQVLLINGANANNVYWQVGSSATFLASTDFAGNVLASTSITAGLGSTVDGRLLALNGALTLNGNTITAPAAIPEPATTAALVAGLMGLIIGVRRIRRRRGSPAAT